MVGSALRSETDSCLAAAAPENSWISIKTQFADHIGGESVALEDLYLGVERDIVVVVFQGVGG